MKSPPVNEKQAYFLAQAKKAEEAAAKAPDLEHKLIWNQLAEQWHSLAKTAEGLTPRGLSRK
jgi:hypothetical protein